MRLTQTFSDDSHNALLTAICNAAEAKDETDNDAVYNYLENTPKASLTVELVRELNKLGFKITKI